MNTDTRSSSRRLLLVLLGGALLLVAGLTLARLSAYGIWDPWELSVADAARKLSDGTFKGGPITVPLRLVSASFSAFGAREWAGRLPMALSGLALLGVTYAWVSALADRRAGVYAALVLASTPFFLLHSREMVGATPAFLGSALVMMGASSALFGREQRGPRVALLLGLAALGGLWGAYSAGVLSTVAPPLLSVSALVLLTGHYKHAQGAQRIAGWVVLCATAVVSLLVLRAVLRHAADFSVWLGGVPLDGALVTYERPIEHLFHGFAPWSAVLPVALACLLRLRSAPADARAGADGASRFGLGLLCVLWASLAYGAQSILLSSFGPQAYIAPGALAVAAALWLREREEREESDLGELIVIVLLLGLIIRDFALYPGSPFGALEIGEAKAPDVFNPKRIWSLLLGLFGGLLVLTSMAGGSRGALDLLAPYRGIKKLWRKSGGHRSWLVVFAATLLGLLVFGVLAFAAPRAMHITSLGARIGRALMFVPLALPLAVAGGQLLHHVSVRLDKLRSIPLLAGALLVGAYTSQVFLPKLSAHLSPRVVFDSYNELAKADEPLAQHRIEGRAAAYYAKGEVREIAAQSELVDFLASGGRKWAVLPSDQLSEIDVGFRRKHRPPPVRALTRQRQDHAGCQPVRRGQAGSEPVDAIRQEADPRRRTPGERRHGRQDRARWLQPRAAPQGHGRARPKLPHHVGLAREAEQPRRVSGLPPPRCRQPKNQRRSRSCRRQVPGEAMGRGRRNPRSTGDQHPGNVPSRAVHALRRYVSGESLGSKSPRDHTIQSTGSGLERFAFSRAPAVGGSHGCTTGHNHE